MKFFSKTLNVAKRAVAFNNLKDETLLIKDSAQVFVDNLNDIKKAKEAHVQKKFSDLNPEEVAQSLKLYTQMFTLFSILSTIGVLYFLYSLANHRWELAFSTFFFMLLCGVFCFRFHFFLAVIKQKNLNLGFKEYFFQFFKKSSSTESK